MLSNIGRVWGQEISQQQGEEELVAVVVSVCGGGEVFVKNE